MFRAKDRAQLDLLKAQLDAIQSHMAGCTTMGLSAQLKQIEDRLPTKLFSEFASFAAWAERIEHGQSVLKADRDADIARMTDRDIAFGEEFLAMSRRLDAIELSQCKTLSLLAVSVKSPAKSAKKRSKKP